MAVVIIGIMVFGLSFGFVGFLFYRRTLRRAKNIERGLKMVPLLIHLPPRSSDTEAGARDVREVMREKVAQAEVLYNLIAGTATEGFKSKFYGQRHIALEMIASKGLIHFYAAVPVALVPVVQNAIQTAYPGAKIEEAEDHNIFNPQGKLSGTTGGELVLKTKSAYPIATIDKLERDPLEALINSLSGLKDDEGAGIQIMLRPAGKTWVKKSLAIVKHMRHNAGSKASTTYNSRDILMAAVKAPEERRQETATNSPQAVYMSDLEQSVVKAIEEKTTLAGYEVLIRVLVSGANAQEAQNLLREVTNSFALYDAPGLNGFKFLPASDMAGLVTAFILRFFPPELNHTILNSQELASLFHLPDAQFTPNAEVERQTSKQVDGPVSVPTTGLLLGYNFFRGTKKEIRLSFEDRRRHTYIVGQTGTGKSTILQNLAVQDMLSGNGFCFIDPHGDEAEKMLSLVPKNRAEDVVYFNPGDTEHPLGLNIFEFTDPAQKDFLIQESINMLYKMYDPGKTGIIGPRFEQWYRNAALTIMSDPAGASFIEIPKVFTDANYLKAKFKYVTDPTVVEFWTKEMAQTSDYHKSEMLGWFASKFGAFQQNEIMRNVIGQIKSAFNFRDIMDNKKILIVNLSKGKLGDLNSQLLGIILVIKFQAAAMSRANVEESARPDFCLYVDEFQNFSTDSFASILSEARKYHLNLIVANQFIGQLTDPIRDAVFGNVGTVISYRTGPEDAEFLVKQFAPIFDAHDLVNLPNHNAVIRLMVGGLPSQPFSITALPPLGVENPQLGEAMKQLSAAKFGVNRVQVEQEIFARLSGKPLTGMDPTPMALAPSEAKAASETAVPLASPPPAASAPPVLASQPLASPTSQAPLNTANQAGAAVPMTAPLSDKPASITNQPAASAVSTSSTPSIQPPALPSVNQANNSIVATAAGLPGVSTQPAPTTPPKTESAVLDIKPMIPPPPPIQPQVQPAPLAAAVAPPKPVAAPSDALPTSSTASPVASGLKPDEPLFHVPVDPSEELAEYAAEVYPNLELPKFDEPADKSPKPVGPAPAHAPVNLTPPPTGTTPVSSLPTTPAVTQPAQATIIKHPNPPAQPMPPITPTAPAPATSPVVSTYPVSPQTLPKNILPPTPPPPSPSTVVLPTATNELQKLVPLSQPNTSAPLPESKPKATSDRPPQILPSAQAARQPTEALDKTAAEPVTTKDAPVKTVPHAEPLPQPAEPEIKVPSLEPIAGLDNFNNDVAEDKPPKPSPEVPAAPVKNPAIILPKASPKNIFQPEPESKDKISKPTVKPAASKPLVAAGEIYVDEDGNVIQG